MKIAVVLSRVPYPLEKGDKLRAYHQIKYLAANHEIFLFCLTDETIDESSIAHLKSFCREVHVYKLSRWKIMLRLVTGLFSKLPFQVHYFFDRAINQKLRRQINLVAPDRIYCQLIRMSEYVKDLHSYDKTLDYMDVFSKGMERREHQAGFFLKPFIKAEYRRLLVYENRVFDYFEKKVIISRQDRDLLPHKEKSKIQIVPNGVDTDYFTPIKHIHPQYDLLFHGNLSYAPNVECVRYLVEEILPALGKKGINTTLLISGASPSAKIKKLCEGKPGVHLAGFVDDVRSSYSNAKILVAPFSTGTGLQNKLLEGMSMQLPCVTSYLCFNALDEAVNRQHLLVGATLDDYTNLIIRALSDEDLRKTMGINAREYVKSRYSWAGSNARLEELIVQ